MFMSEAHDYDTYDVLPVFETKKRDDLKEKGLTLNLSPFQTALIIDTIAADEELSHSSFPNIIITNYNQGMGDNSAERIWNLINSRDYNRTIVYTNATSQIPAFLLNDARLDIIDSSDGPSKLMDHLRQFRIEA